MSSYGNFAERFFQCAICLDVLKNPKILPCLHRYCRDCLKEWMENTTDNIACPECKKTFSIPTDGVDGFQSDYNTQSQIEYIQQQEIKHLKCCIGLKTKTPKGFCFKCNDFLCEECFSEHVATKREQDHQMFILTLKDIQTQLHLTEDKLMILAETPTREILSKDIDLANEQRKELNGKVCVLNKLKSKVSKLPNVIDGLKAELITYFNEKTKGPKTKFEDKLEELDAKIHIVNEKQEASKSQIEEEEKQYFEWTQDEMNAEIEQVKKKYDQMFVLKKRELEGKNDSLQDNYGEELTKLNREKELIKKDFEAWKVSTEREHLRYSNKIQEIWMHFDNAIERFEILTAISSLFLSENHMVALMCIPDILTTFEPLIKDIKLEFPELHTLLQDRIKNVPFSSLVAGKRNIISIIESEGTKVNIEGGEADNWCVDGITGDGDGHIVITGMYCEGLSYIMSLKLNGKIHKKFTIKSSLPRPKRYCAFLSKFKVATVCWPNRIAVFDVSDSSHITTTILDAITKFPNRNTPFVNHELLVSCVATDASAGHIFVGEKNKRRVFMLDKMLNYRKTFYLPKMLQSARDMAVSEDNLLICDEKAKRAIAMRISEDEGELMFEFDKPDKEGCNWAPFSICTDMEGFIYMLWRTREYEYQGKCIFAQYGPDDPRILTTRIVDGDSQCIATIETKEEKRIVVATTKYLYSFLLVHIDGSNNATSDA